MRIALVTAIISPHQMPLARQIVARVGAANFRYIAVDNLDEERTRLGWEEQQLPAWFLLTAGNVEAGRAAEEWLQQTDVVLCGNRDLALLRRCVCDGKLTFYMSERWFKPWVGKGRFLNAAFLGMALGFRRIAQASCLHYLAIGDYAAQDMWSLAAFPQRMWLWGYYVDVAPHLRQLEVRTDGLQVLWAGRMVGWKRVDLLIDAVACLRREGRDCQLTLVGSGARETTLRRQVDRLGLGRHVTFRPSVPIADMRGLMREAEIYVLPSNGYEGWGAVINEALSEGCCVIASRGAGAAVTMLRHGENGLLFRSGDLEDLCACLRRVYDSDAERIQLARAGYETVKSEWTPAVAAERWLAVCEGLMAGRPVEGYASGPMQKLQ